MYRAVLFLHSWMRWIVLLGGLCATAHALQGVLSKRGWKRRDRVPGVVLVALLDGQILQGTLLYVFLSPLTSAAFSGLPESLRSPVLRFWSVEHLLLVVIAIVLVHVGQVRLARLPEPRRFRSLLLWNGLAWLAVLSAIPWPVREVARPLFRT